MQDPTLYLGPHELLMTIGLCVPKDPAEQAAFVARLDDAGISGLMIGDHDPAPPLSPEMFAEADRRNFPILLAGVNTACAVVARHVAAANWFTESLQVLKLSKLYHVATYAEKDLTSLLHEVVPALRAGLSMVDAVTGITLAEVAHPRIPVLKYDDGGTSCEAIIRLSWWSPNTRERKWAASSWSI